MNKQLKVAFVSDLHYSTKPIVPSRKGEIIPVLLADMIGKFNREIHPDLVLFGGDLINDSTAEDARRLTGVLAGIISLLDMPYCVIRGNHDLPQEEFTKIFPFRQITDVDFLRVVAFDDPELPQCNAYRRPEDYDVMRNAAKNHNGLLVSLQHCPLTPDDYCCYNYKDNHDLLALMKECGYRASIAGHHHEGIPLTECDGLQFYTPTALCAPPCSVGIMNITQNGITNVETLSVPLPDYA